MPVLTGVACLLDHGFSSAMVARLSLSGFQLPCAALYFTAFVVAFQSALVVVSARPELG